MKNISKTIKKIVDIVLLMAMVLSIVSCSNTSKNNSQKKANRIITTDTPWFDAEIFNVDLGLNQNKCVMELFPVLAGTDGDIIVVFADGVYQVEDWDKIKTNADYLIKNISLIDRTTKQIVKVIDLYSIIDPMDLPNYVSYICGKIFVKCNCWDSTTNTYYDREYCIDVYSEKIVSYYDYDHTNHINYTGTFIVGDYKIDALYSYEDGNNHCPLKVYSPDGSLTEVDISDSKRDYYEIPVIIGIDKNTALIPVVSDRGYYFYRINLNTCKISEVNSNDFSWFDVERCIHSYSGSDGKLYFTTSKGVSSIDFSNKLVEQVIDYDWCGVNRQYLSYLEIADYSEESFLLCGQCSSSNKFASMFVKDYVIVEFKKADKNPHAGKTIIELYSPDGNVNESISDAMIKYNNNNDEFFIVLSDRNNKYDYLDNTRINSDDEFDSAQLNANAKLSDNLAMDLINGEGPDILLNTSILGQLNNDSYLIDLLPYVTELDSDKYFLNIIEGAKKDDKIYQLPISFTIVGIQTDPNNAGITGIGFTFEEYETFLYETLNGRDVIDSGQSLYLVKLFDGMSDKFIVNGKVCLTDPEFAELATFVKDNVHENSISWDAIISENSEPISFTTGEGNRTAYYCNCPGISGYLVKRGQIKNGTTILGIPSTDGRGPMFGMNTSVAVSECAVNVEACVEFVKLLLSDDIQKEIAMSDELVLSREAFRQGSNAAIEYYNSEEGSQNLYDYEIGTYVTSLILFTNDDIDNLESVVLCCTKMYSADSAIDLILVEEMPAFFLGQKDLDDVVTIVQDRAQKAIDERG